MEATLPEPINTLFWDVGGVLLTNAWDHDERRMAFAQFHLDEADFTPRHEKIVTAFEQGKLSLDEYLDQTIFYRPRDFTKAAFKNYIFPLSQPKPESLALAAALAKSGKYRMATLNNESREFNLYRIQIFGLREIFSLFISSCYVGLRKPDEAIYRLALDVTQTPPERCCFIDDRAPNLEAPSRLGMHTIQMKSADQLAQDFAALGVAP